MTHISTVVNASADWGNYYSFTRNETGERGQMWGELDASGENEENQERRERETREIAGVEARSAGRHRPKSV